jgi:hypothetical protein
LSGIFLKDKKDCGQAAMTESDNDVVLLMNSLVRVNGYPVDAKAEVEIAGVERLPNQMKPLEEEGLLSPLC